MPQIAIIQPATPKGPPQTRAAGAPGKKEQNEFSPHLDKAVSKNKKQQADQDENRTIASSKNDKNTSPEHNSQLKKSQELEVIQDIAAAITADQPDSLNKSFQQLSIPDSDTEKSRPIDISTAFSQLQQIEPTEQRVQDTTNVSPDETGLSETMLPELSPAIAEPTVENRIQPTVMPTKLSPAIAEPVVDNVIKPTVMSTELSSATAEPAVDNVIKPAVMSTEFSPAIAGPVVGNVIKPTAAKEQLALIDQLQRIIDQGNETGTVSITKAPNATPTDSIRNNINGFLLPVTPENSAQVSMPKTAEPLGAAVNTLLFADADGAEKTVARPAQQLTALRQDSQQQYFNPKIATKDLGETNQNFQEHRQGDELPQQTMGSGSQNGQLSGLSSSQEQTNTFSQIVTSTQQTTTQPTDETAKPILLPSGTIVQEDEIFQQLSHKLQISSRHMDSRINLKLHPAELGSLKIDLTVKEGSIRANVVAQSQHTSEILEKNMAKLKTILENQGFTVDEISVTTESESVSDFNLFDRQLFGQNDYAPKAPKGRREDEAVFTLPDNVFAAPAMRTGVNVKI